MIQFVCPDCTKHSDRVKTKLVILALGYMRVVPGREAGVERAIASPVRATSRQSKTEIEPDGGFICSNCGEETPSDDWKYVVVCDHCGKALHPRALKNPSKIVDKYICRDTMSTYCDRCWSRYHKEYCEECRFNETCSTYNNR